MSRPLFERVLGAAFAQLPPLLRALHSVPRRQVWHGQGSVRRGRHWLVAPCAWLARLPPSADAVPVTVEFVVDDSGECWNRRFGAARMASRLWQREGRLFERLGAVHFRFALHAVDGEIHWRAERVRAFGIVPLPAAWFAQVRCREREHAGRYEFLVDVALPLVGPLIRYEGWLLPGAGDA
ncbi:MULTISPECIES: DUF4166 domain-containing protein [Stenotrophomonas]|uniref:DUF4166 domain-containing protein n=1 Tax=Stenotrophomonas TaxID=40323 RepID=UPI000B2AFC9F|nr:MULTISPECIES: DUF4166 domain-containing protein [Stenotrophomonas]